MQIGNVMVGQSGGPTSVINASLAGVLQAAKEAGAKKVYGMRNGIEGLLQDRYIDIEAYVKTALDIELLKRTPSSFLGSCRYKLPDAAADETPYRTLFATLKRLEIAHVFYIGGNDSMDTIEKLSAYARATGSGITFMGVPKTIDNDLAVTDHTPGYGSAAKYIASAMKEIIRDSTIYPMESVTIVEIMGRNTGWLTAAAALSKGEDCAGPDLIYLPETPFSYDRFLAEVNARKREKQSVVVAVSEGIRTADGSYVCEGSMSAAADSFGHRILNGAATYLAEFLTDELGVKARGVAFSTLQRCASHIVSRRDITEAHMAGAEAAHAAVRGETGKMIIFSRTSDDPYQILTAPYDVDQIANIEKPVPTDWITADGTGVLPAFLTYARPLIIGELTPFMVDGLPRHLYLKD